MKSAHVVRADVIDRTLGELETLAASDRPIVVGPWLGEIGFELLYWIPFLRWALSRVPIAPDRLTVISRGGCRSWYAGLASHYLELYDHYTPIELRTLNMHRVIEQGIHAKEWGLPHGLNSLKQYHPTSYERTMLARVSPDAALLHPGLMYVLFRYFWRKRLVDLYRRCATPARISAPPRLEGLPTEYVAVKFYTSSACRDRAAHQQLIERLVTRLAARVPVVLLDSGAQYDSHGAFAIDSATVIRPTLDPPTNLATQTAVIAHASAFVGTYGGFAYLAPLLGVPTTAFYADQTYRQDHYQVAVKVFEKLRSPFTVAALTDPIATQRHWKRWAHAA